MIFQAHNSSINSIALIDGTNFLASGGNDGVVKLHEISHGQGKTIAFPKHHSSAINCVDFNQYNHTVTSVSNDHKLIIWDFKLNKLIHQYYHTHDTLLSCESIGESVVISCGIKQTLNFYDTRSANLLVQSIKVSNDNLNSLSYSQKHNTVNLGNSTGELIEVDLRRSERAVNQFLNHKKGCLLDVFTYDRLDGTLLTFESGHVCFLKRGSTDFDFDITTNDVGLNRINSRIWSSNNRDYHVVSGSNLGVLNHWCYNEGSTKLVTSTKLSDDIINNVQYDVISNRFVCGTNSGKVHVLEGFVES